MFANLWTMKKKSIIHQGKNWGNMHFPTTLNPQIIVLSLENRFKVKYCIRYSDAVRWKNLGVPIIKYGHRIKRSLVSLRYKYPETASGFWFRRRSSNRLSIFLSVLFSEPPNSGVGMLKPPQPHPTPSNAVTEVWTSKPPWFLLGKKEKASNCKT